MRSELKLSPTEGARPRRLGRDRAVAVGLVAAALWTAMVAAYAVGWFAAGEPRPGPPETLVGLLFLLAALGPAGFAVFLAVFLSRGAALADEIAALRAELAETGRGRAPAQDDQGAAARRLEARLAAIERRLAALGAADAAPVEPASVRAPSADQAAASPEGDASQADLPFAEGPAPPDWETVARALDFPRDETDAAGFAAIEAALRDPQLRELLQAAEDVLAILAAEGAHMEDLAPEAAPLSAWAAYAAGARGAKAAAIGGVRDEAALAAASGRIRRDPVFRDACLVFCRRWNLLVARIFRDLGPEPAPMAAVADSRAGRAFMLVSRALGAFE